MTQLEKIHGLELLEFMEFYFDGLKRIRFEENENREWIPGMFPWLRSKYICLFYIWQIKLPWDELLKKKKHMMFAPQDFHLLSPLI